MTEDSTKADPLVILESLLFVASRPAPLSQLARALDVSKNKVVKYLQTLEGQFQERGLRLQWHHDGVQITSAPEANEAIEKFLGLETTSKLSAAALETLSILAYLQPVTRPQVDQIRGVNSDGSLRTLLSRSLIEEVGRMDTPGRPILYGTTVEFLQRFGLNSLAEMPALEEEEE